MDTNKKIEMVQTILHNEKDLSFEGYSTSIFASQNNEMLFIFEYSKNIFNIENVIKAMDNTMLLFIKHIIRYNIFLLNDYDKTNNKLVIKIYLIVTC